MNKSAMEISQIYQSIFHLIPDCLIVVDKDLRIVLCNWAGACDHIPEELRREGLCCYDAFYAGQGTSCNPCHVQEVFRTGRPITVEKHHPKAGPLEIRCFPLFNEEGKVAFVAEQMVDISRPKKLEEQLLQSQKMEVVARMGSGLAHDFNNLLLIVQGYSELLLNRLENEDLRQWVENIYTAGKRATTLTEQLLALSRGQKGHLEELDLRAVVAGLEKLIQQLLGRHVALSIDSDPVLGAVRADRSQIEQVITNLVFNAKDVMAEGGRLTIKIHNVNFANTDPSCPAGLEPGPYVLLAVSDTGSGMNAITLSHIFEPFFTTKELGKGTGLGLPIAYTIVQNHSGHIDVFSAPGEGTTFSIYLPQMPTP
ncbi:MAG: nitrogen regulation protein NR(II) [Pedobacter sp.]